jgi:hypothetical protein
LTRTRLPLLLSLLVTTAAAGFFDIEQVNEIRLTFSESNWDDILDSLYAAGQEGRLVGTAVVNGRQFDSVGVRYKGGSSYSPGRRKNPLNIKLDEFRAGQTIEGHGTLRLANVFNDPSFVREALSYEICRQYMPAGESNFTDIYVNDTLIGLYSNDEDVDRAFMRVHFYCDKNARFKGRLTDSSQMIGWKYLGPDSLAYFDYFELESDSGWSQLIALFDTLNNQPAAFDRILDVDQHLWMLAFDALFVNLDAPVNMPQNHYLYRDASARFNPIVWDLNESFGVFRDLQGTGVLTVTQMQQLDPFLRQSDTNYPIASKVLADARLRRMYVAHMKTMIAEVVANNWYRQRALAIQDIIDPHVQADQNKFYSYNDFVNNVTRSVGTGPLAVVGLTELMGVRASYVMSNGEFQAAAPVIGSTSASPDPAAPNAPVQFVVDVSGADSVWLGFRQSPAYRFVRIPMFDDGAHGDGAAGDGRFGAVVQAGSGDIEYYFYAENSAAGAFHPARAEHEHLSLPVAGAVVINEVMADNVATCPDPSGQYDDWIEFYNPGTRAVSLDGCLLTDDSTDLTKWVFPDTAIPVGGYLIVWADSDMTQPGLHASFRLSSSGDMVVLSDEDGDPLDQVVFGPQDEDVSFGRFPDGAGVFRLMTPTPGAANQSGVGIAGPVAALRQAALRLAARPNPFRNSTKLSYTLVAPATVRLRVYDAAGRLAASLDDVGQAPGRHDFSFSPTGARPAAGVYFAQLCAGAPGRAAATECVKLVVTR